MNESLPGQHDMLQMVLGSGPVVQAVLLLLIFLSIWSWAITFAKALQFVSAKKASQEFNTIFWENRNFARVDDSAKRLESSPLTQVFLGGYKELSHQLSEPKAAGLAAANSPVLLDRALLSVQYALKRAEIREAERLEKGITFLACVASAAPFIGLFGTVWGIMNAFRGLSMSKSTTIQAVAPGISEALVATAIGLAAAIPAAIAFNYFSVAVRRFRESMDKFGEEFLGLAATYLRGEQR
jgi:biopolymer transport protein TolQ